MDKSAYNPPVDQLLTLGETDPVSHDKWPDYLALGIGPQHIPELFRMVNDESLNRIGKVEGPEDWASIHAVRAIAQLRDESTIEPLVELLSTQADHEWIQEELPEVFGMIGPAAIPALSAYLADDTHELFPRAYASGGLIAIAQQHPESRDEAVRPIVQQLEKYPANDPELNAMLISDLAEIKATETLPLIEQAFEADRVDKFYITLDDVLVFMGLKEAVELPSSFEDLLSSSPPTPQAPMDLFTPPPGRITGMSAPTKFSGKRVGAKKAKRGKKR